MFQKNASTHSSTPAFKAPQRRGMSAMLRRLAARRAAHALAALPLLILGLHAAHAGNDAWSTNPVNGNFSGVNWTLNTTTPGAANGIIAAGDSLYFGTSSITTLTDDEAAGFSIGGLNFNPGAAAYTIGGNSFALNGVIANLSANLQTINDAFTMAAQRTFTTTTGGGNLTLGGAISGAGSIIAAGTGTLTFTGTLALTGGSTVAAPTLLLNANNTVNLNLAAGTSSLVDISTGNVAGSANTLNITSGTLNVTGGSVGIAAGDAGGAGVINQTGGTVTVTNNVSLGDGGGGYGNYNLSGGTLGMNAGMRNGGYNGTGANSTGYSIFSLSGTGTVNNAGNTIEGRGGTATTGTNVNILNITAGNYNQTASSFFLGYSQGSTGILNISGGLLKNTSGNPIKLNDGGGTGTNTTNAILNLNGGVVQTNQIVNDNTGAGNAIVNFNGGILQANANNQTAFLTGMTSANIFSGGATIDTNGNAITIGQALLAPAGSGLSGIALASGGSGYIGAPVVVITGGGGTGATALANISGGVVTGFTITSAGTGYTSAPTVTLQGGGGTGATLGTISTAANTSGGLTKIGGGTLTLTGTNTYTGTTTVSAGTLQLGFATAGASNILASGSALTLGGGTLNDNTSATTGTNTQTLGALTLNGGASTISMTTSGATNSLIFTGALTRTAGSVDFIAPTGTSITLQQNLNAASLGSYAFFGTGATETYAGTDGSGNVIAATLTPANGINAFNSTTTDYAYSSPGSPDQLTASRTADAGSFNTASPQTIDLNGANTLTLNGLLNTGGALTILNSVNGGTGTLNIGLNNELVISGSSAVNIGAPIANNGATASAFTDSNTGTLTLTAASTYTGATKVGSGSTLQLGDGTTDGTIATTSGVTDNGALVYNWVNNHTVGYVIGGTGSLTKNGAGTETLTNTNTYTGGTTVNAGTLQLGDGAANNGSVVGNITDSAALTFADPNAQTYTGVISGTGTLTKSGTGNLTLSGINTFTGGTTVNSGTLTLNNGGGAGAVRGVLTVNPGATLTLNTGNALGYTGGTQVTTLNINGGLVNVNGNLGDEGFITAFNLTGGTMAYAGTGAYQISAGDATAPGITSNASATTSVISGGVNIRSGNLSYTVASGSTGSGVDLLDSGVISGGYGITKNGPGVLALTGVNTYSAGTTVSAGTLEGTTTGLQGAITDNAAVVFDQTLPTTPIATGTYAGVISGSGTVAKNNAGTVTLTGANAYTGATSVNGGSLFVNNSLASAGTVSVAGGARLGGTGSVGTTTVASGGSVEGGQFNAGTLTTNGLTFSSTGNAYFGNLANYTAASAIAAGALTVNGGANSVTLNVSGTVPGAGTYELLSYTGSILGTGSSAFQLATLPSRATGTLDFSHAGLIDLNVTGSDFLIWTGAASPTNGWDTVTTNWKLNSNGAATTYIDSPGDTVVFDDTAATGTVNLNSGDVHPTSVTFNNNTLNYTVQGTKAIAGTTGLTKTGVGTVTLTNTNSYTGLTSLNGGVLDVGSAGAIGTASTLSFGGGTLQYSAANQTDYSNRFSQAANQAYSVDTNGQTVSFATALNSTGGSLAKTGAGTLTLNTFETYTGGTTVNGGTLKLITSSGTGNVQGAITVNTGGTLSLTTQDDLGYNVGSQVTTLNINGGTVDNASTGGNEGYSTNVNLTGGTLSATGGGTFRFNNTTPGSFGVTTFASATTSTISTKVDASGGPLNFAVATGSTPSGIDLLVSGQIITNSITKTGTGTMSLTGANTYTGGTTVSAGTLEGTTTGLQGAITDNAAVVFDQTLPTTPIATGTYAGVISGSGTVAKNNAGTVTLTGANAYTGATTISAGILQVGSGGTSGTLGTGAVTDNAALAFNRSDTGLTVANAISGSGTISQTGTGTTTLTSANTYTGTTTITAGTLTTTGSGTLGTGNVTVTNTTGGALTLGNTTSLASTSNLFLTDSGTTGYVNLNFTGTDSILGLSVNGTFLAPGTYGSSASAAPMGNQLTEFSNSGMGTLIVAAPEPSQFVAFGLGMLGLGGLALKARKRKAVLS